MLCYRSWDSAPMTMVPFCTRDEMALKPRVTSAKLNGINSLNQFCVCNLHLHAQHQLSLLMGHFYYFSQCRYSEKMISKQTWLRTHVFVYCAQRDRTCNIRMDKSRYNVQLKTNCFYQYLCNINIDWNMLASYVTINSCCAKRQKTAFFVKNLIKKIPKSQFYVNADENLIYVQFVSHLTISPLWHVYLFAYDRFNWRDGIRYSYMSFCAKSASISLVDFSVDIVASKTYIR